VTVFGIDHAGGRPPISALIKANVQFVCRYLSHNPEKNLTPTEAAELGRAGIWIVVVWETTAQRALSGHAGGAADAREALKQAERCGMPRDRPIFFAVDWDAQPSHQDEINAYLDGAASVLGRERVGLYAGYNPMRRAFDARKIAWGWQTYAWSAGHWDNRAHLQQYKNDQRIGGRGVDFNRATADDYGQWKPGVSPGEDEVKPGDIDAIATAVVKKTINARGRTAAQCWQTADDGIPKLQTALAQLQGGVAKLLQAAGQPVDIDEAALAALITPGLAANLLTVLTPAAIADALPDAVAEEFLDALTSRLAGTTAIPTSPPPAASEPTDTPETPPTP
jgi:Domain of unknown function (DUF1906)